MTAHDMLACRNSRGATLVAPPEYRVQLKPESAARGTSIVPCPIVPVSAEMANVLTNNTATMAEAERVLEAVWPEPAARKVKTNTLPAAAARLRSPRRSYRARGRRARMAQSVPLAHPTF